MLWRLAARFVTGPVAFLIAGLIDIGALLLLAALAAARARIAKRVRPKRVRL